MKTKTGRMSAGCVMRWLSLALVTILLPAQAMASEQFLPGTELVAIGGIDNLRKVDQRGFGTLRAHFTRTYWDLHPFVQVGVANAGSVYGGVGMFYDFKLAPRMWLTFGTGPGLYRHKGNDPDLGSAVEFATWIEVTTIVLQRRVGLGFSHLSNAHLGSRNPGTETLGLVVHLRHW